MDEISQWQIVLGLVIAIITLALFLSKDVIKEVCLLWHKEKKPHTNPNIKSFMGISDIPDQLSDLIQQQEQIASQLNDITRQKVWVEGEFIELSVRQRLIKDQLDSLTIQLQSIHEIVGDIKVYTDLDHEAIQRIEPLLNLDYIRRFARIETTSKFNSDSLIEIRGFLNRNTALTNGGNLYEPQDNSHP